MRRRFVVFFLFALPFAIGWWAGRGSASSDLYTRLDTFVEILHRVEDSYVEIVEPQRLIDGAAHGLLRVLDPYAEYLDARAVTERRARENDPGEVGLVLGSREHQWTVIHAREDGPAARAGIESGDVLVQVDGLATSAWSLGDTEARLRGAPGSKVAVRIQRGTEEHPRELSLTREPGVRPPSPSSRLLESGIGLVRVATLGDSAAAAVRSALDVLRAQGAQRLVLDLRGCTDGTPLAGAKLAELFLASGTPLLSTRGRASGAARKVEAGPSRSRCDWPLAVLIDGSTAGAAEVAAGALQDADRALIVGRTSFGMASVQSEFKLEGGASLLRMTTSMALTPSGRPIQRELAENVPDDEEDGPDSTVADTVDHTTFRTHSGRKIEGGGGIRPDVAVIAAAARTPVAAAAAGDREDADVRRALEALRNARSARDVFAAVPASGAEGRR